MVGKNREKGIELRIQRSIFWCLLLFVSSLFAVSVIGMQISNVGMESVLLIGALILPAYIAGYILSKESKGSGLWVGFLIAFGILLILAVSAFAAFGKAPGLKACIRTGCTLLVGSEIGALLGERRRPKRRR